MDQEQGTSNSFFQDEIPRFYKLPSLVNRSYRHLRELNSVDNEEIVGNEDFVSLVKASDKPAAPAQVEHRNKRRRRAFSVNETANYSKEDGRPLERTFRHAGSPRQKWARIHNEVENWAPSSLLGIEDEYIPDFRGFQLGQWIDDDDVIDEAEAADHNRKEGSNGCGNDESCMRNKPAFTAGDVEYLCRGRKSDLGELHSHVKPVPINADSENVQDIFASKGGSFGTSWSPERAGDRALLSSLPENFQSLSFSERRRLLGRIVPEDAEYRGHVGRLIRRNSSGSSRASSTALRHLNSFTLLKSPIAPDDTNTTDSVVAHRWKLGTVFDRGAFGEIRDCTDIRNESGLMAMKVVPVHNSAHFEQRFRREILMWSLLEHNNILQLEDFTLTSHWFFMLMPKVEGGSLFDQVKSWETFTVPLEKRLPKIKLWLKGLCSALEYLHDELGVCHGDVKLENCLIDGDRLLLCDFGMANFYTGKPSSGTVPPLAKKLLDSPPVCPPSADHDTHKKLPDERIGSLPYASPELVQPNPLGLDNLSDMWAVGVILYTLVTLRLPFCHKYEPRLKMQILNCSYDNNEGPFENMPAWTLLLHGCLRKDRSTRLNAKAALALINAL